MVLAEGDDLGVVAEALAQGQLGDRLHGQAQQVSTQGGVLSLRERSPLRHQLRHQLIHTTQITERLNGPYQFHHRWYEPWAQAGSYSPACCWWRPGTLSSSWRPLWRRLLLLTGTPTVTSASSRRSQLRRGEEEPRDEEGLCQVWTNNSSRRRCTYCCGWDWCAAVAAAPSPGWPRAACRTRRTPRARTPDADWPGSRADCLCSRCPAGSRPCESREN